MDTAIIKINGEITIVEILQSGEKFTYFKYNGDIHHMRTEKFNFKMNEVNVPKVVYFLHCGDIIKLNLIGFTDTGNAIGAAEPNNQKVGSYTMPFKKWLRLAEVSKSILETLRKEL